MWSSITCINPKPKINTMGAEKMIKMPKNITILGIRAPRADPIINPPRENRNAAIPKIHEYPNVASRVLMEDSVNTNTYSQIKA